MVFPCSEIVGNLNDFLQLTTEILFSFPADLWYSKHMYFSVCSFNSQNVQFAMKIYNLKYHYQ